VRRRDLLRATATGIAACFTGLPASHQLGDAPTCRYCGRPLGRSSRVLRQVGPITHDAATFAWAKIPRREGATTCTRLSCLARSLEAHGGWTTHTPPAGRLSSYSRLDAKVMAALRRVLP